MSYVSRITDYLCCCTKEEHGAKFRSIETLDDSVPTVLDPSNGIIKDVVENENGVNDESATRNFLLGCCSRRGPCSLDIFRRAEQPSERQQQAWNTRPGEAREPYASGVQFASAPKGPAASAQQSNFYGVTGAQAFNGGRQLPQQQTNYNSETNAHASSIPGGMQPPQQQTNYNSQTDMHAFMDNTASWNQSSPAMVLPPGRDASRENPYATHADPASAAAGRTGSYGTEAVAAPPVAPSASYMGAADADASAPHSTAATTSAPSSAPQGAKLDPAVLRAHMEEIYSAYIPDEVTRRDKVSKISKVVEQYAGKEDKLLQAIYKKYNVPSSAQITSEHTAQFSAT
jgi:hypothetical protein